MFEWSAQQTLNVVGALLMMFAMAGLWESTAPPTSKQHVV